MFSLKNLDSIDYLVIGHLTVDQTPDGPRIGGTAAYSALTARALGLRAGIVTSWAANMPLGVLRDIPIINLPSDVSTTFQNVQTPAGRRQTLLESAEPLGFQLIPDTWRTARIVHLGPVAQEVEPAIVRSLSAPLLGATPQGWLRNWDGSGQVYSAEWPEANFVLGRCNAAVISVEDVDHDEERIEEMAAVCPVLAVTESANGARLFWNGDVRRFRAPQVEEVDPTGSGDVFAAAFFTRLYTTRDPWEAARFATQLASFSVTRSGLHGVPTPDEINQCMVEVF